MVHELGHDPLVGSFVAGHVSVPAQKAGVGECLLGQCGNFLRADAEELDAHAAALRAVVRCGDLPVAVVTAERFAFGVVGEGDGAVRTFDDFTTVPAHYERCCSAPVQEQDDLLVCIQGVGDS